MFCSLAHRVSTSSSQSREQSEYQAAARLPVPRWERLTSILLIPGIAATMATKQKAQDEPKAPASSDDSAYLHTYLVRVGLLARGMLLRGRITTFNHMVNEVKKDCPVEEIQTSIIKDIHPAMPSSEIQFWLLSDASRQLESSFSVMFLELLSGKLQTLSLSAR